MTKDFREKYLVGYVTLAKIVADMILTGELKEDAEIEPKEPAENFEKMEKIEKEIENKQMQIAHEGTLDQTEHISQIEKGLDFTKWLEQRSGKRQQEIIGSIIRQQFVQIDISSFEELERSLILTVDSWLTDQSKEYAHYLKE